MHTLQKIHQRHQLFVHLQGCKVYHQGYYGARQRTHHVRVHHTAPVTEARLHHATLSIVDVVEAHHSTSYLYHQATSPKIIPS
jgi:hypothetical protein